MSSTSGPLTPLMTTAATILECGGDGLAPLSVMADAAKQSLFILSPLGARIAEMRTSVDRLAEILGGDASLRTLGPNSFSYSAEGDIDGIRVIVMASTPLQAPRCAAQRLT
ncbi:hypothetical protein, partial [Streptomyces mirabilis]|uniref:hypothetical protein n=1 Tax=Streptomyces mirabilis TaxID=68239 RepID=UPI0036CD702D